MHHRRHHGTGGRQAARYTYQSGGQGSAEGERTGLCTVIYRDAKLEGRAKLTVIRVSNSTGRPFRRWGSNRHCRTASVAAFANRGSPLITLSSRTTPSFPTKAFSTTGPSIRRCLASSGYSGSTRSSTYLPAPRLPVSCVAASGETVVGTPAASASGITAAWTEPELRME